MPYSTKELLVEIGSEHHFSESFMRIRGLQNTNFEIENLNLGFFYVLCTYKLLLKHVISLRALQ